MAKKKIYRSIITVEILSDSPVDDAFLTDLSSVDYETTSGGCSGQVQVKSMNEELTGHEAVKAVQNQGSSPDFFMMDEEGEDVTQEDDW